MKIETAAPFFLTIGPALVLLPLAWFGWRRRQQQRRARYIEHFDFARLLDKRLARRRPELNAAQRQRVLEGLRDWFHVCLNAGRRRTAMPSQAVDDAWHEFILFTRNYQAFCRQALGRFLHHVPAEAMASPTHASEGLKRSWQLACRRAHINPATPVALPLLFALDAELGLADGFRYQLDCLRAGADGPGGYCASHIGCSGGGADGDSDADGGDGDGGSSCGGGCGGD